MESQSATFLRNDPRKRHQFFDPAINPHLKAITRRFFCRSWRHSLISINTEAHAKITNLILGNPRIRESDRCDRCARCWDVAGSPPAPILQRLYQMEMK
jgi:hypothetical protein